MKLSTKMAIWTVANLGILATPILADEPMGDLAKLQGTWTAMAGPNKDIPITFTFKDNKFERKVTRPDGEEVTFKGELKLDEKANPKTYDFVKFKGPDGQEIANNLGIYKLESDSWTTCSGGPGNDRPTRFESGSGGPPNLVTWTRVKDKVQEKPIEGDLGRYQGIWTAKLGANEQVEVTFTVKVNAYTATWATGDGTKFESKGELRVNEKATPFKTIDFFHNKNNNGEDSRDNLGIYEIEGEKIKICLGGEGNERPAEFKKGDEGPPLLLTFTKKKD